MVTCDIKVVSGGFKIEYSGIYKSTSDAAMRAIKSHMKDGKRFALSVEEKHCKKIDADLPEILRDQA
ncbi:hypothetical protein [Nitrosomonas marina]|uniref:Uncharacterized protein n=1 Tax=Nitrosomonas marina TaxID=917 RepID=A0A1H8IWS9_9PROT|nr:hypothetical protein [Nitrosomonas marina]SEN73220.1 hypothetical protein SAMN05216325_1448 [Nitrosomonas marina]